MNKKFAIIISFCAIVLVVLLISLAFFRPKTASETITSSVIAPTTIPIDRSFTPTTQSTGIGLIEDDAMSAIEASRQKPPFESDTLSVEYSPFLESFYVQNTATDDANLKQYLADNNLTDVFQKHPEAFKFVTKKPSLAIDEDEKRKMSDREQDFPGTGNATTEQQKQINALSGLFGIMSNFSIPTPEPTIDRTSSSANQTQVAQQSQPTTISYSADTTNIPCATGTDAGTTDGYKNGQRIKIRLCRVRGSVINSQVSKQVDSMFGAASLVGLNLSGGSFRNMGGQIGIYQSWCQRNGIVGSPPPYPKLPGQTIRCPGGGAPGYSNHQMGLAIDISCNGSLIPQKYSSAVNNPCFKWLQANAGKYGFFEVGLGKESSRASGGYEGWHWSVNGN